MGSAEASDGTPEEDPSGSDTDGGDVVDDAVDRAAVSAALTSPAGRCAADAPDTSGKSAA
ncbi:hypothetical protein [Arthrobacter crystallopoietes]|uniref:hypothetical protein n=1 Tax=Crystallibacter crystallopoietes TaxID=37928 RepID=UPI000C7753B3|nr:hypothetical protein [Arthrobacter crystallopoietes]AUI51597.1 hypothetical protein AC20117_13095 [Arthrobacter crystallopoietes]